MIIYNFKLTTKTLMWEIEPVVLERIKFDYRDTSCEYEILGIFRLSKLRCEEPKQKLTFPRIFKSFEELESYLDN